jgi:glycosyltransferase involved in cell wall biosynthesis
MTSVALLHYAAPPVVGGVENVITAHAALFAADGHDVRIVAGRGANPPTGVRLDLIPRIDPRDATIAAVQSELNAGRIPTAFPDVVEELATALTEALEGVEVLIAHNVCSLSLNLALTEAVRAVVDRAALERRPLRLILWHHDLAARSPDYRPWLHPGRPWDLLREAWPGAIQVAVSEARRQDLVAITGLETADVRVVPNGIDLASTWRLQPRSSRLLHDMDALGVDPLVLVPQRITPRKNLELAIRIVAELRRGGRPAGLVVTGPVDPHRPAEQAYLDTLLQLGAELGLDDSVVRFLATEPEGPPSDAVMDDLYRIADAVFLPSRDEGFGLPLLEAGALRVPILCSDLDVLREIGDDDVTYVGPDENPGVIASRLVDRLDTDPAARLRRRIRDGYDLRTIYRRHVLPLVAAATQPSVALDQRSPTR